MLGHLGCGLSPACLTRHRGEPEHLQTSTDHSPSADRAVAAGTARSTMDQHRVQRKDRQVRRLVRQMQQERQQLNAAYLGWTRFWVLGCHVAGSVDGQLTAVDQVCWFRPTPASAVQDQKPPALERQLIEVCARACVWSPGGGGGGDIIWGCQPCTICSNPNIAQQSLITCRGDEGLCM